MEEAAMIGIARARGRAAARAWMVGAVAGGVCGLISGAVIGVAWPVDGGGLEMAWRAAGSGAGTAGTVLAVLAACHSASVEPPWQQVALGGLLKRIAVVWGLAAVVCPAITLMVMPAVLGLSGGEGLWAEMGEVTRLAATVAVAGGVCGSTLQVMEAAGAGRREEE